MAMNTTREFAWHVSSPAPRDVWARIIAGNDNALVFQTPEWTDGLCATGDYEDASRLYETADGRQLILPLVQSRWLTGTPAVLASMPDGWGMGGLISDKPLRSEDAAMALADLGRLPSMRMVVRPNPLTAQFWPDAGYAGWNSVPRVTHILNLEGGFDAVWNKRFSTATRTKIRKAEKAGMEVTCATGGELLDVFYDVYMEWIDRRARERHVPLLLARWLGRQREPLKKFQYAAKALGDAFRTWVVRLDNRPIAVAILLVRGANAFYWRSASVKEIAGPIRANDLLQIRMIEDACSAGALHYHMGESGGVDSLMHFKSRFGAEGHPYNGYFRERFPLSRTIGQVQALTKRIENRFVKEA